MTPARRSPALDPARVEAVKRARTRWRHEVADLGGPNTLLWHRTSLTGTFDLNLAHPGGVAKLLSGRATLLSELVREQVALADAARRIGAIRDKVGELRREHGVEAGFLAIGLATWTLHRVPVPPRAPVLLRSCRITPTDPAHSDYLLELHEDVVFNPVLEHYLRSEAHLDLDPAMLAGLSAQDHGFDPRMTYQALEDICREMTGFAIGPQMVISTFPWAKLPLVTTYTGDVQGLAAHDTVAALAGADVPLSSPGPDPERADDPAQELSALDADRAQRLVVDEAVRGASLVLDTPAGTGATQTIANVVVAAVSEGRTVLVTSEERTALDALQRRLDHVGLGDLCLHLAEDPASMRTAVGTVRHALDRLAREEEPDLGADPLPARSDALDVLRRDHQVLHHAHRPWELSLAQVQDDLAALAALEHPPSSRVRLPLKVLRPVGEEELSAVTDALIEAAAADAWPRGRAEDPWYAARLTSPDEAARATEVVARLVTGEFTDAREMAEKVAREAGMPAPANLQQWGHRLDLISRAAETLDIFTPQIYDAPLEEMVAATADRDEVAERPGAVARARLRRQVRSLLRPGTPPADLPRRVRLARDERAEWESVAGKAARPAAPEGWEEALAAYTPIGEDLAWLGKVFAGRPLGKDLATVHLDIVLERLVTLDARADRAPVAATAHPLLEPLREQGLGELVDDLARRGVPAERVASEVRFVHRSSLLVHLRSDDVPQQMTADAVREAERTFRRADRAHLRRNALRARRAVLRRLRRTLSAHASQLTAWERAVERTQVGAVDLRDMISRAPDIVLGAQPVVLASPLAVPSVLPPDTTFDLVVVERAGRTTTARAVPALAHGRRVLVVGDSGGLGPVPFSVVADPKVEGDTPDDGGPSLLDDASGVLPVRHLQSHYRALDQGLVAPLAGVMPVPVHSFPGVCRDAAVREHVEEGPVSAQVASAVALLLEHAATAPEDSLMVVTDDEATAEDVDQALRGALADLTGPGAPALTDDDSVLEPLLVRPLRRVAGEVRDRVVWVTGPHQHLVRDARLATTAIAAARRRVDVVTPLTVSSWPDGEGADVLRRALSFRGQSGHGNGSAVLAELTRRLREENLTVVEGYAHGPHALDLAVASSDGTRMVVAVDSDVHPAAHGAGPGRDDLRLRHDQLTRMGWVPLRVRSTDVFTDPAREVVRVLHAQREAADRSS
ncbi:hypothetical protein [Ornithinimicrobium pekingense]|uniref:Restriction endonuclease type II-like domain-containing protein n=1 Tax=Ornithinimicrobium pekingense TaxID=384677 RepID=A0ABQ2FBU4_9MICO|nr:hypothetical protein [Ornithinimicrobium pekingense]GGK81670.1 hypothetical protein GCM10011509_32640 [Ornithinimicrobium pekingense]